MMSTVTGWQVSLKDQQPQGLVLPKDAFLTREAQSSYGSQSPTQHCTAKGQQKQDTKKGDSLVIQALSQGSDLGFSPTSATGSPV